MVPIDQRRRVIDYRTAGQYGVGLYMVGHSRWVHLFQFRVIENSSDFSHTGARLAGQRHVRVNSRKYKPEAQASVFERNLFTRLRFGLVTTRTWRCPAR